ncbi:transmembrane 6 superfamily member 1 [Rhipicephalus microplus]|uniref:transmembrane 6 superfamily member 1 n=1 Tax=Rhipicephalus microplus TaxID=6941 RepID=UPI003F6C827B
MSSFSAATKVFGVSLLAVPATYSFNVVAQLLKWDSAWPVCLGVVVVLAAVAGLLFWATGRKAPLAGGRKLEQIWFYALAISAFTSVASLTVGLELDGIISGFVNVYLKVGEPYLRCSHGAMASYWHGTVMYAMHLMMLAALTWDGNLYSVALFWCGSNINSTLVLLLGVATGKHGITPGAAFYLLVAIASLCFLYQLRHQRVTYTVSGPRECLFKRKHDIVFLLYLFAASFITIFRGLAVLGTNIGWINRYVATVEPYLQHKDPAPFPKMQMLVYLFHHLPLQLASAYALLVPSCQWMPDLSLLIAGAVLQGQVSHIGASFHPRTPYVMRVPPEPVSWLSFWVVNLLLALGFQFLAYRCNTDPEFFAALRSHSDRRMS